MSIQQILMTSGSGFPLDPLWSNVVLALHGDGANGSTTITDSKLAYTPSGTYLGSVAISNTTSPFAANPTSIKFPNSGGLIYASGSSDSNFVFGTGDFCFRQWVWWDGTTANAHVVVDTRVSSSSGGGLVFYIDTDGKLKLYSGTTFSYTASATFPSSQWVHLALARASGTARILQGGAVMASPSFGANLTDGRFAVGDVNHSYSNPTATWSGYMKDVEVIKGQALYTGAYTPPTAEFPNS